MKEFYITITKGVALCNILFINNNYVGYVFFLADDSLWSATVHERKNYRLFGFGQFGNSASAKKPSAN